MPAGATTVDRADGAAVGRDASGRRADRRAKATALIGHGLDGVDVARALGVRAGEVERDARRRRPSRRRTIGDGRCWSWPGPAESSTSSNATAVGQRRPARPACAARRRPRTSSSGAPAERRRGGPRPHGWRRPGRRGRRARSSGVRELAQEDGRDLVGEQHGRDAQALLVDLGGVGRDRARAPCPPTSAWWARLAAQPTRRPSTKHGATSVMSLRWVPPAKGSLRMTWSPGRDRSVAERVDGGRHRRRHRAEVHRDVLGLHEQLAVGGEQRGRAVGPLLDVRAERGPAQHGPHLLGHAGQAGRSGPAARPGPARPCVTVDDVRLAAGRVSTQAPPSTHGRPPAVRHPDGAVRLGDHGRTRHGPTRSTAGAGRSSTATLGGDASRGPQRDHLDRRRPGRA